MKRTQQSYNSTLKRKSKKQIDIDKVWKGIVADCIENRARYRCEINWLGCWVRVGLQGHHIVRRSQGGRHTKENCIIGCPNCHNHAKWSTGIPLSRAEARIKIGVADEN